MAINTPVIKVRLIRHGESQANAGFATDDPATIPLTPKGWEQARAIAESFESAPDLIICSPFLRAQQTAAPTIERFPGVPVETWDIQEFTYLDPARCAGTTVEQRRVWVAEYWNRRDPHYRDDGWDLPQEWKPRCEPFSALKRRATEFVNKLEKSSARDIVVFGHGQFFTATRLEMLRPHTPIKSYAAAVNDLLQLMRHFPDLDKQLHMANGQICEAEYRAGRWIVSDCLDTSRLVKLALENRPSSWKAFYRLAEQINLVFGGGLRVITSESRQTLMRLILADEARGVASAFIHGELVRHGLTPRYLVEHHMESLRRIRLEVQMGILDVEIGETDEDLAHAWLQIASTRPKATNIYGIDIAKQLEVWAILQILADPENALEEIPEEVITEAVALVAARECEFGYLLPQRVKTERVYLAAVQAFPMSLGWIPADKQTTRMQRIAVSGDSFMINYIPERSITPELVQIALKGNPKALLEAPPGAVNDPDKLMYNIEAIRALLCQKPKE